VIGILLYGLAVLCSIVLGSLLKKIQCNNNYSCELIQWLNNVTYFNIVLYNLNNFSNFIIVIVLLVFLHNHV